MLQLIDFSHWVYRNYFVNQNMARADGQPIGAVSGCCEALWRLVKNGPSHAAIICDGGASVHRKTIYPDYKAQRPPVPDGLKSQFALCQRAAQAFGFPIICHPDVEADDSIATYARIAREAGMPVMIHTTDKDLMQLVRPGVSIHYLVNNQVLVDHDIVALKGVRPDQIIDWQALHGDASDNIPGVPKIGEKTAAKLLNSIGDLDAVIEAANDPDDTRISKSIRETLVENAWLARKSAELATLVDTVPDCHELEALRYGGYVLDTILDFCSEMEIGVVADSIRAAA